MNSSLFTSNAYDNPQVTAVGAGWHLWWTAALWSYSHHTDGFIPEACARKFYVGRRYGDTIAALLKHRLFEEIGDGFRIVGFEDFVRYGWGPGAPCPERPQEAAGGAAPRSTIFTSKAYDSPRITAAGPRAVNLWWSATLWSCTHRTNGFVPEIDARRLYAGRRFRKDVKRLLKAGLLERVEGGYCIVDFDEFERYGWRHSEQTDSEPARHLGVSDSVGVCEAPRTLNADLREKRREAGRRGAAKRWQKKHAKENAPQQSGRSGPIADADSAADGKASSRIANGKSAMANHGKSAICHSNFATDLRSRSDDDDLKNINKINKLQSSSHSTNRSSLLTPLHGKNGNDGKIDAEKARAFARGEYRTIASSVELKHFAAGRGWGINLRQNELQKCSRLVKAGAITPEEAELAVERIDAILAKGRPIRSPVSYFLSVIDSERETAAADERHAARPPGVGAPPLRKGRAPIGPASVGYHPGSKEFRDGIVSL